jgi:Cu+-exporting ATPase
MGVLFRNAEALEVLARSTRSSSTRRARSPRASRGSCPSSRRRREPELLRARGGLERGSEHPLAAAIVRGAEERGVTRRRRRRFESLTGTGVRGRVEARGRRSATRAS